MHQISQLFFMYIDSHAHLLSKGLLEDADNILSRAQEAQLRSIVVISCRPEEWNDTLVFCKKKTTTELSLHPTTGIHPDYYGSPEAPGFAQEVLAFETQLQDLLNAHPEIVAIGECGLDYYREYNKEAQIALFEMQIRLALKHDLPLVVHIRDAFEDFFTVMKKFPEAKVILHCFTGNNDQAEHILQFPNTVISFSGIVTFDKTGVLEKSVQTTPLERMLIETDSPYLAPAPKRGKTNEPSFVIHTASKIAEIKGISVEETAEQTTQNAIRVFGI